MTRRAARTDDNHGEIVRALRQIGCYVVDCAHVGRGFPDIVVGFRGHWILIEIKDGEKSPSRRRLRATQEIFQAEAGRNGCRVHVVTSVAGAIKAVQSETLGRAS